MKLTIPLLALLIGFSIRTKAIRVLPADDKYFLEHLKRTSYDLDTSASAVVLYENITYSLEKGLGGFFTTCRTRRIIHILNKSAVDLSSIVIRISSSEHDFGSISNIKGVTYNLVDGQISRHSMPDDAIKIEKISSGTAMAKFSLPSVSAGSIIDYTYDTKEELDRSIGNWRIQERLPKLTSECCIYFPAIFKVGITTYHVPAFAEFNDEADTAVNVPAAYATPTTQPQMEVNYKRWVRHNITAAPDEPYTFNPQQYKERIVFRTAGGNISSVHGRYIYSQSLSTPTWRELNNGMQRNVHVFGQLKSGRLSAVKQMLNRFGLPGTDTVEYARQIYRFVRDSFTCKEHEWNLYTARELPWVVHNKMGNRLDLHLALIAALRDAGLKADPVILSTRDQGKLFSDYPETEHVDYVVTRLAAGADVYYLDPTNRYAPFGILSPDCYNGYAWVVNDTGMGIMLNPEHIKEKSSVQIKTTGKDGDDLRFSIRKVFGKYTAMEQRERWNEDTLAIRKELLEEAKRLNIDAKLLAYSVYNLSNPDTTLIVEYAIRSKLFKQDIIFTPTLFNYFDNAPFTSAKRLTPVEFPYATDFSFSFSLTLPDNFAAEDLPTSGVMKYNEDNLYKYMIDYNKETNCLMLNTRLNMQQTTFQPEEYESLKQFLDKVIEAQQKAVNLKKTS